MAMMFATRKASIAIGIFIRILQITHAYDSEKHAKDIRGDGNEGVRSRHLTSNPPYYVDNNNPAFLPRNNFDITIGNPLKGLVPDGTTSPTVWPSNLPASLTTFKWPLNLFMLADPEIHGEEAAFNWTWVESNLAQVAQFQVHAIVRFWIDWPGQPFRFPQYLLQPPYNLTLVNTTVVNVTALNYDDPVLKKAINQAIQAFARRYDGDPRIYAVQAGMLGAWGEWHSRGVTTIINGTVVSTMPSKTADEAVPWYREAFKKTHVQFRYPDRTIAHRLGFGYHDDSYTFETLGGTYNGNANRTMWFFWNITLRSNTSNFWKNSPMGGEVRPLNVDTVFTPGYPAYTPNKQDFGACVDVTHTSYMGWGRGWSMNSVTRVRGVNGTELLNARNATVRMGYSFEIDSIAVSESQSGPSAVDIAVTIKQTGAAPFYYNLNVSLYCNNGIRYATSSVNISRLLEEGDTSASNLLNIPSSRLCLDSVDFRLESTYLYPGRPIRWAQGTNNGTVVMSIPPIPTRTPTRVPSTDPMIVSSTSTIVDRPARPLKRPIAKPMKRPKFRPVKRSPVKQPLGRTVKEPVAKTRRHSEKSLLEDILGNLRF